MKQLLINFYEAFQKLNAEAMVACYHPDVVFEDPAFGELHGKRANNMWRMLCESQKGKEFKLTYSNVEANQNTGSVLWESFYTFSKTNKKVHNVIQAQFKFKDGKIIEHIDEFDLYDWSKQAFGVRGRILGKTLFFKNKLKHRANFLLTNFENKQR